MTRRQRSSLEGLDQRFKLNAEGFIVGRDRRNLAIDSEQSVNRDLGRPDRIFDCEDDIIFDFDKLTHKSEIA